MGTSTETNSSLLQQNTSLDRATSSRNFTRPKKTAQYIFVVKNKKGFHIDFRTENEEILVVLEGNYYCHQQSQLYHCR